MYSSRIFRPLALALCLALLSPATALADSDFTIRVSNPDRPPGETSYKGTTINTVLSVPQLAFGDNRTPGTLRITGRPGVETPVRVGDKVMVTLPLGSCYMQAPTAINYRNYVSWPAMLDGLKNQISDHGDQPGMRFISGTPRSITLEVNSLDETAETMVVDFVFDKENLSKVRVSRLLEAAEEYADKQDEPLTRLEFFQLLSDITLRFPSCPVRWTDSEKTSAERFLDLEGVSPSKLDKIKPLIDAGVISGYPDGTLKPFEFISRAEAASLAGRILPFKDGLTGFKDVTPLWVGGLKNAFNHGLVVGYPDGTFKPDRPISRAETLTLLQKTHESYQPAPQS